MAEPLLLDLSRLLSRAGRAAATGIDRVEMAYARHYCQAAPERLVFTAVNPLGRLCRLPQDGALDFLAALAAAWGGEGEMADVAIAAARLKRGLWLAREGALHASFRGRRPFYLLVSHHHLTRPAIFARLKARTGARIVCLVHDLIPISHPEYSRAGQAHKHVTRMTTVALHADGVIVNSESTGATAAAFFARAGRVPPILVAPLGIEAPARVAAAPVSPAYFVCLGTIEPRKNHLLLLDIWRELARTPNPPLLHIVGQRGWENDAFIARMEKSPELRGLVFEHNALTDRQAACLLKGTRALLMPSFVEGYGLPVGEALAAGVPVICSPLPSLRQIAGAVPDYLPPEDRPGWAAMIRGYAAPDSPARIAQLARLEAWTRPSWDAHFAPIPEFLARL